MTLLGASKRHSIEHIRAVHELGIGVFGENYVPELLAKAAALPSPQWHFIGHLQRNKAKKIAGVITMLHTLDTARLADRLSSAARDLEVLVQVNIGEEPTKSGALPQDAAALCRHVLDHCPGLVLSGLMTIPPPGDPDRWLGATARLRADLEQRLGCALPHLSMGMTADLEVAIAHGATIVRIGSALFGPRG